jgi:hypothetical protein
LLHKLLDEQLGNPTALQHCKLAWELPKEDTHLDVQKVHLVLMKRNKKPSRVQQEGRAVVWTVWNH